MKAFFHKISKEYYADSIVFRLIPPLKKNKYVLVMAANDVDGYDMGIWPSTSKGKVKRWILLNKPFLAKYKKFKETLEKIGYRVIKDIPRKSR